MTSVLHTCTSDNNEHSQWIEQKVYNTNLSGLFSNYSLHKAQYVCTNSTGSWTCNKERYTILYHYRTTVIHFFSSSKFLSKKYWRKIISHRANWTKIILQVWWALIEEITPRAEEMADEKEMACCVRGYHVYKDIWAATIGEVLVLAGSQPTLFDKISL